MNVSVCVLPSLLQYAQALAHVLALYLLGTAKARHLHPVGRTIIIIFIVELQRLGSSCTRNAHVNLAHGILCTRNGFHHGAREDAACGEDADVDDAYRLALHHMRIQLGTLAAAMLVRVDADICLHHSAYLGIYVAVCPGTPSLVGKSACPVKRACRSHLVQGLVLAAHQCALLNVACYPRVEVSKLYQFLLSHGWRCHCQEYAQCASLSEYPFVYHSLK